MVLQKRVCLCIRAAWRTLNQLSKLITVKFLSINLSDVSAETCGLSKRLSVFPFLVKVRERLCCKSPSAA